MSDASDKRALCGHLRAHCCGCSTASLKRLVRAESAFPSGRARRVGNPQRFDADNSRFLEPKEVQKLIQELLPGVREMASHAACALLSAPRSGLRSALHVGHFRRLRQHVRPRRLTRHSPVRSAG